MQSLDPGRQLIVLDQCLPEPRSPTRAQQVGQHIECRRIAMARGTVCQPSRPRGKAPPRPARTRGGRPAAARRTTGPGATPPPGSDPQMGLDPLQSRRGLDIADKHQHGAVGPVMAW